MTNDKHDLKIAPPEARPNKYYAIARTIKNRIMTGEVTHKLPSVPMMAQEFSVTPVTMQKALNLLKEDGCVVAIPGKGSFITRLKRPRTQTIGVVISSTGPLAISLTKGIQDRCSELKQSSLLENYGYRKTLGLARIKRIAEREQVDGFILWPDRITEDSDAIIAYLEEIGIPYVLTPLVELQSYKNSTSVTNSDHAPAADIMTHLIGTGRKKIGFVKGAHTSDAPYNAQRYAQYKRSLEVSGLQYFDPVIVDETTDEDPSEEVIKQLKQLDGVFCSTDTVALIVSRACLRNGIRVPKDLAVASINNSFFAQLLGITSNEQNFEKIGARAIDLLLEEIEGHRSAPVQEVIEGQLIIRQSSQRTE